LVAAVAATHPWATRDRIRPAELVRAELISLGPGTGARAALDALLRRAGSSAEPRWEVSSPTYVRMLTSRGLGVGIVSATTAHDWEDVVTLRITDDLARSRLGLVRRSRPSHAARALLHLVQQPPPVP
jgi:DNA-binding transcriptional LysR family regulator